MTDRRWLTLNAKGRALLGPASTAAFLRPFLIGFLNAPSVSAQSTAAGAPKSEVASIKASTACESTGTGRSNGGGRVTASPETLSLNCFRLVDLIQMAYGSFAGGQRRVGRSVPIEKLPAWTSSARYAISAKAAEASKPEMLQGPMLQALQLPAGLDHTATARRRSGGAFDVRCHRQARPAHRPA